MQAYLFYSFVILVVIAQNVQGVRNSNRTASAGRTGGNRDERALKSFMHKVATGRALSCQSGRIVTSAARSLTENSQRFSSTPVPRYADCGRRGGNKCVADKLKLCGRAHVASIFKAADEQTCVVDKDCQNLSGSKKLTTRCSNGKCDFCGPKVCLEDSDCCGASGLGGAQKCAQLSGYPEKRCWNACTTKGDCTGALGGTTKLACQDNICQKKTRKPKAGVSVSSPVSPAA